MYKNVEIDRRLVTSIGFGAKIVYAGKSVVGHNFVAQVSGKFHDKDKGN